MSKIFFNTFFFLVALFASPILAQTPDADFTRANELYTAQRYQDALTLYLKLDSLGYESGELYFNIGNSAYKLNQVGISVLYYEKAKRLLGNDDDVQHNLDLANLRTKDRLPEVPEFFLESVLKSIIGFFGVGAMILFFVFLYAFITLAVLRMKYLIDRDRLSWKILQTTSLVLTIFFAILVSLNAYRSRAEEAAVVMSAVVNIKSEPKSSGATQSIVHEGLKVLLIRSQGNWLEVQLPDGNKGWVEEKDLRRI
jgi:tetratricopeptide (TPR) repeat protein